MMVFQTGEARRATFKKTTRPFRPEAKKNRNKIMSATETPSLETSFLNHVCAQKMPLTIFLVNGVKLQGSITWVDATSMLLSRDGHSQLVYKHAISTIMPLQPIEVFEGATTED
jgi:host factor-I protein